MTIELLDPTKHDHSGASHGADPVLTVRPNGGFYFSIMAVRRLNLEAGQDVTIGESGGSLWLVTDAKPGIDRGMTLRYYENGGGLDGHSVGLRRAMGHADEGETHVYRISVTPHEMGDFRACYRLTEIDD